MAPNATPMMKAPPGRRRCLWEFAKFLSASGRLPSNVATPLATVALQRGGSGRHAPWRSHRALVVRSPATIGSRRVPSILPSCDSAIFDRGRNGL